MGMHSNKDKPVNTIDLVIFDCDGVLIDSEIISARMLQEEVRRYGLDFSMEHVLTHFLGRSFPKVLATMEEQFSMRFPENFEEDYRKRLMSAFDRELVIIPGVEAVIEQLNVPFCIATSSSPKRLERSMEIVGLSTRFGDKRFTASMVKNGKPAPDLFLHAARQMGARPQHCLVIEDSEKGVEAGIAAGMKTTRFTGGSHLQGTTETAGAELVFDKFADFFNYYPHLKKQV